MGIVSFIIKSIMSALLLASVLIGCRGFEDGVDVRIRNGFDDGMLVRRIGFRGCMFDQALSPGEETSSKQCLPGVSRAYYEALDPANPEAGWQKRRTAREIEAVAGTSLSLVLDEANDERDPDAPGPYGH